MTGKTRFEQMALPHRAAAFNLAYWIVGRRDEADDVVQDAYLRAFRAFAQFKGEDIRPWLLTIVRNVAYRALNTRKRGANVVSLDEALQSRSGGAAREFASEEPLADSVLIAEGERELLLSALAELPLAFRDCVVLREIEGLSYREIAEVIGAPIGTVMSRLARGRVELRTVLKRRMEKDETNAM